MNGKKKKNSYQRFLFEADRRLKTTTGIGVKELPNFDWRQAHQNGIPPAKAAQDAMLKDKT